MQASFFLLAAATLLLLSSLATAKKHESPSTFVTKTVTTTITAVTPQQSWQIIHDLKKYYIHSLPLPQQTSMQNMLLTALPSTVINDILHTQYTWTGIPPWFTEIPKEAQEYVLSMASVEGAIVTRDVMPKTTKKGKHGHEMDMEMEE
ncbi:MAG: hypothetical protein M1827_002576 [Pycnora praestabilis]|nr:MAG: hypothetical protein M1827_002576 [Pycnora praestabilis]